MESTGTETVTEQRDPRDPRGTHQSHCCAKHGCKYGHRDCVVVDNTVVQDYACEDCTSVKTLEKQLARLQKELEWSQALEARGLTVYGDEDRNEDRWS